MKKKPKVVYYLDCWGVGGIERFVISAASQVKKLGYNPMVFAAYSPDSALRSELESSGASLYVALRGAKSRCNVVLRMLRTLRPWCAYLMEEKPDIVHINIMNGVGFVFAGIAKMCHVETRVVHSHNASVGAGLQGIKTVVSSLFRILFGRGATARIACSESAGRFLYGCAPFRVVHNGIDAGSFGFDSSKREGLRFSLGVGDDTFLIGNPSRLAPAKNPVFMLDVLRECLDKQDTMLVLCEVGELADEVAKEIDLRGLADHVVLLPPQSDMQAFYSALDVLLFPSIHEGLPFVLIEAQCNGLPVVVSDSVTNESRFSEDYHSLSLKDGASVWAKKICEIGKSIDTRARSLGIELLLSSDFDCNLLGARLDRIYMDGKLDDGIAC